MMAAAARIPVRFHRVAAAFDADVARVRLCESSGSEHSPPETFTDLSDLVKSFMESSDCKACEIMEEEEHTVHGEDDVVEDRSECFDSEKMESLQDLFSRGDDEKELIRREVEVAVASGVAGEETSSPEFKRKLMSRLREKGFDAGLCKSKWEKNGRLTAGDYEYIDVNLSSSGKRYIVEVSLASEFDIARPTIQYSSVLRVFPQIFIGRVEELKEVVKLMCGAIKGSMKTRDLHVAPWRRNVYMQAKWFGSYKRTTNAVSTRNNASSSSSSSTADSLFLQRSIGFEPRATIKAQNCRDDYAKKTRFRNIGHLTSVFNSDGLGLQL
ncbi:hypothetical protein PIB30_034767 [Stylosanthes scabra]|uniref:DUF506 family protein n=1 Tax=Stylosanthes scabra TaxID=79078 RepID=A0ABU6ZCE2_9FABA|nr:hypothetical protein [Stylosanthes scabra]